MSTSKDIICVTMTTWEGDYMKTIVHMMKQLSKNHRVLFVDYPFTHKDLLFSMIGKSNAPTKRMLGVNKRLRKLDQNLFHLTLPPIFPTNWIGDFQLFKMAVAWQSKTVAKAINNAADTIGFKNPLVINAFNPIIGLSLLGRLNESGVIYYCYDEIRAAGWCGKHGGAMEDEFIQQVDGVVTTSSNLYQTKIKKNKSTHLVRNGVDFTLFNKAADPLRFENNIKTIGYLGSIDFRLDYDLLEATIQKYPEYKFKFVGRITDEAGYSRLKAYENVSFSGGLQPHEIPKAIKDFNLGLIPFVKNEFTKNVYPLKINEYLAAGIPVVSTDFADLSDFENQVSICESNEAFSHAILLELDQDIWEKSLLRFEIAKANDWESRAMEVERVFEKLTPLIHA